MVLGGIHPTVLPEEAKKYCDSVITGEAEPVWGLMLDDALNNRLKGFYHGGTAASLDNYPLPRRDLIKNKSVLGIQPIVTSRGCPYSCESCSVWRFFGRIIRHVSIDIDNVIKDIEASGTRRFMFLDDNIVGDPAYAEKLFNALSGMNIEWVGQASISFVKNVNLLKLAHRSGCRGLFFGLETISEQKMKRMNKSMKTQADTLDAIKCVMDEGIIFHASMVFGFDNDDESVFDETLKFMHKTKIPSATFNILTSYPGTDIYKQFKKQGRLITEEWDFYDHCTVTYLPRNMSVSGLYEGYMYVKNNYYSLGGIIKRFPANYRNPVIFALASLGLKADLKEENKHVKTCLHKLYNLIELNYKQDIVNVEIL